MISGATEKTNGSAGRENGQGDARSEGPERSAQGRDAADTIGALLSEIRGYAAHYLAVQRDILWNRLRMLLIALVLAVVAAVGLIAAVAMTVVLFFAGLAGALARAMDASLWAGQLAAAGIAAGTFAAVAVLFGIYQRRASYRKAVSNYEHRREVERAAYGRDAAQRAQAPAPSAR